MKKAHLSPIFFLTLSYIGGILWADYLRPSPLIFLFAILIVLALSLINSRRPNIKVEGYREFFATFSNYLLFFLLGCFLTSLLISNLSHSRLLPLAKKEERVVVEGRIISEPRLKNSRIFFDLKGENLFQGRERIRLSESIRVVQERFSSNPTNTSSFPPPLAQGERIILEGKLSLPQNFSSNSSLEEPFDYKKYLYRKRIQTIMNISFKHKEGTISKIRDSNYILAVALRTKEKVRQSISQALPGPKGSLMLGILIGDTEKMPDVIKEDFRRTGLAHIWAVSGMNVGILVIVTWLLLKVLGARANLQVLVLFSVVGFYVLITGGVPSVLRASVMALLLALGWLLGRRRDLIAVLSFSAFFLLLYDPFLLFNISFQLSYAATLALIFLTPYFQEWLGEIPEKLKVLIGGTLAAQLGVAPLLVSYFNQISIISFIANLLVVPVVAPVLILGIFASFLHFLSYSLAHPFYWLSGIFLGFMLEVAERLSFLSLASIYLSRPSSITTGFYYLILFGGTISLDKVFRRREKKLNLAGASILVLLFLAVILWWQVGLSDVPQRLEVTFLDVGQGDSSLVQTPGGEIVLIDGGEDPALLRRSLESRGVRRIDLLVLSHPHSDHVGGLVEVVARYKVGLVLDSGSSHPSFLYRAFLENIDRKNISYEQVHTGLEYKVGDRLKVQVLHPSSEFLEGTDSDINNNSVVVRLLYGRFSVLFPGDAQEEAQFMLLEEGKELKATVLKVPHQGSADASNFTFLREVSPKIAVIMVGEDNPYGHPASSTLGKLKRIGAKVYRTDKRGDIIIESDGLKYQIKTEK